MNSAARVLNQGFLSRTGLVSILLTRSQLIVFSLILAIMATALSIVYVTNMTRSLNAILQQLHVERDQYRVEEGQLLLEQSTWSMPARIQRVAEEKLDMGFPNSQSVVVVE